MPGLTVTEKQHWKDRIEKRIEKKLENLAAEDPNLLDRLRREAWERALASLGLSEMQAEVDAIEQQRMELVDRDRQLERAMLARVRGVPVESIDENSLYRFDQEVDSAVNRRKAAHEDELLADSELGQRILKLRQEKENLLDTVWLATSPKQIKELWSKVAELLGERQTQLEKEAMAIDPVDE